ncbi:hypothetical protein EIP91_002811 [Steccherinum ochraceum]|uniref:Uncharacterized protein n=1 Tax=Steccherinum ochraceum TaxID=92696 RepID=A0A4R0RHT5_9APHY|nr:hypothetical protein EIP91_002811 [Steccherinum ochraceum]
MHRRHVTELSVPVGFALCAVTVASELLVCVCIWIKTSGMWRESFQVSGLRPPLIRVLLCNETAYFGSMAVMNTVGLIYYTQASLEEWPGVFSLTTAFSTILVSRFILDLRSVYSHASEFDTGSISSLRFSVRSVVGNIRAPLASEDSIWLSGSPDDVSNEHD